MSTKKKSRTPNFNAYRPVEVSDGITRGVHHTFDTTVPFTADDQAALEKYGHVGTPRHRISTMQSELAALAPITNPHIQVHVDEIRAIHSRLKRFTDDLGPSMSVEQWMNMSEEDRVKRGRAWRAMHEITERDETALERADYLWGKIVTLQQIVPVADHGRKFKSGRARGAVGPLHKMIARVLTENPCLRKEGVWKALRNLSEIRRDGWEFCDNSQGRYIGRPKGAPIAYGTFLNHVTYVKKTLTSKKKRR